MKKVSIKKIFIWIIMVFFAWFLIHSVVIVIDGLNDNIDIADVAVVFGNEVTLDGKPSERLKARLDRAIEIFSQQQTKKLIVSGSTGKEGFDEAKVMAQYLQAHQIPLENIIIDSEGKNSEKTVQKTVRIMKENDFHSVMIISQYFHISRATLAFQKAGITEIYSAHANYFELRDVYSIFREFFAYYWYALK
jgi:vancomycin permeability regulator SanA